MNLQRRRWVWIWLLGPIGGRALANNLMTSRGENVTSSSTVLGEVESPSEGVICRFIIGRQVSIDQDGYHQRERKDYRCQTHASEGTPRLMYDLPSSILAQLNLNELMSGKSILHIHNAKTVYDPADGYFLDVGSNATVEVFDNWDRRLHARTKGTSTVLVVLVRSSDSVNSFGPDAAAQNVFSSDITSFASQYENCSAGKLKFIPATGPNISKGVTEIFIDRRVMGKEMSTTIENTLQTSLLNSLGSVDIADHILYCLPSGMADGWIGYTYGDEIASYIKDNWCTFYTLPMHEVGHQLGLQHSNELAQEYEDKTCVMGKSFFEIGGPKMCFNAIKFYQLNWFPEHTLEIFPQRDGPWTGSIAAFVDVRKLNAATIPIIVKVGNAYLLYNFRKAYNADVPEKPNHVTIAVGETSSCDTCTSDMIGAIHETEMPEVTAEINVGEGKRITFEACGSSQQNGIDMKLVSIRLQGQSSTCPPPVPDALSEVPTLMPTAGTTVPAPLTIASIAPTNDLTEQPIRTPTSQPAPPTTVPVVPTKTPTQRPSFRPTQAVLAPTIYPKEVLRTGSIRIPVDSSSEVMTSVALVTSRSDDAPT